MNRDSYARAEALLPGNRDRLVFGGEVTPRFEPGSDSFRFQERTREGERTMLVDPEAGTCEEAPAAAREPLAEGWSVSPDERWAVRVEAGNIWLLDRESGEERRLTEDGSPLRPYASRLDWYAVQRELRGVAATPVLVWSPDSTRFVTERLDQSDLGELQLTEVRPGEPRPRLIAYRDALPGDADTATASLHLVEVPSGVVTAVDMEPVPVSLTQPVLFGHVWFAPGGERVEAVVQRRRQRDLRLLAIDAKTGASELIAEQEGPTVVDSALLVWEERPPARVLDDGRGLWLSERDGWAHLWLVEGPAWTQLTRGEWVVRELVHLDECEGAVLFTASGREEEGGPLDRRLYRIALAGGEPELLTPEPLDHAVVASPSGRWLIDSQASPQQPPLTVLREAASGAVVRELSRADADGLTAAGWRAPRRFSVTAADGRTELHGLLYLPAEFDESRRWPLLDVVYPGPQIGIVPRRFGPSTEHLDSLAALGMVVMALDARGTPLRSKQFHDVGYADLGFSAALADHAAAVEQLATRHAWIDADRVGILGNSGGGHMAVRALIEQPETFSVAVSGVGNHDNRRYHAGWGERYIGLLEDDPEAWRRQSNVELAARLRGRLLLGLAELDANVHPSASRALIAALVEADVDHDVVVLPHGDHASPETDPYYVRRVWDYLCRHLIGVDPPDHAIAAASLQPPKLI